MEEQHPWTSQQLKEEEKDTKERAAGTKEKVKVKERATEDTKEKAKDTNVTEKVQLDKETPLDRRDNTSNRTKAKKKEAKENKHKMYVTDADNPDT